MPYKNKQRRKEYQSRYMREVWYPKNKKIHIFRIRKIKNKVSNYIAEFKRRGKCVDCGFSGKKYPFVLDFHHLRDKKFSIASFSSFIVSLDTLNKEISKCELICANCHRIRTLYKK